MASPNLPLNQQNALPIPGASSVNNGTLTVVGGTVNRYCSPTDLGINGAGVLTLTVGGGSYYYLATNYLNLTGCTRFAFLVSRAVTADQQAALATGGRLAVQFRLGATDTPAAVYVVGASAIEQFAGKSYLNTAAITFPAGSTGDNQRALVTWSADEIVGAGGVAASFGTDCRFVFDWSTTNPTPGANTFTAQLWASS